MNATDEGTVRALYIMGENPVVSDPNRSHVESVFKKTEFLVVQDIFMTETALCGCDIARLSFAEKDGTFTNTERRVQRVRKAIEPVGNAMADWQIICRLSSLFGCPMSYPDAGAIQDEIKSVTPSYGGITYARLDGDGLQWPCPNPSIRGQNISIKNALPAARDCSALLNISPPRNHVIRNFLSCSPPEGILFITTPGRLHGSHIALMMSRRIAIRKSTPLTRRSTAFRRETG